MLSWRSFLNCVSNGKIVKKNLFKNIWIQPAAGDRDTLYNAALGFYYQGLKNKRNIKNEDLMKNAYLGSQFSNDKIEKELKK